MGEIIVVLGPNGYGKSLLLKTISGIIEPTSGYVKNSASSLSYLGHAAALPEKMTVRSFINICCKLFSTNFHEVNDVFNAKDLFEKKIDEISRGERQRVALTRTLIQGSKINILDEPDAGLDSFYKNKLHELINRKSKEGISYVLSTHDNDIIKNLEFSRIIGE